MKAASFRIGTGAGFSADRLDPAVDLTRRGDLDAIVFECLGERTLASGLLDKRSDSALGYTRLLETRMRAVLPLCRAGNTCLITNMGAANPLATILSFAMMLRYSFGLESEAAAIEVAAGEILKGGLRTADIMQPGMAKVSTHVMGEALIGELQKSEVAVA